MDPSSLPRLNLDVLSKILVESEDLIPFGPVSKEWQLAAEQAFTQLYAHYSKSQNPALQKRLVQIQHDPSNTLKIKHLYQAIFQEARGIEEGEKLLQSLSPHSLLSCEQLEKLSDQVETIWSHNLCLFFEKLFLDLKFFEPLRGTEIEKAYQIKEWMETHPDDLAKIEDLNLEGHNLNYIPKEIGMLKKLRRLSLSENQIREIPKEIGELKNLKELFLSKNQIQEIPKQVSELKNLEKLYLNNNQIREIPKELGKLLNLFCLNLCDNQLQKVEEIGEIKNLRELNLNNNQILEIPEKIGELPNLLILTYVGNKIPKTAKEVKTKLEKKWISLGW